MLHISICDDEQMAAERIQGLIEKELKEQGIVYQMDLFKNGEEFLSQYQIRSEELIFLDIDMPVKSGIEVIEELEEIGKNKDVILITSHDHLVLKSLTYGPFQIIRKMSMAEDIPKAVRRYLREKKQEDMIIEFVGKGFVRHVKKEDIVYLEKYRHNITVHLKNSENLSIRGTMQDSSGIYRKSAAMLFYRKKRNDHDRRSQASHQPGPSQGSQRAIYDQQEKLIRIRVFYSLERLRT